MSRLKRVAIVMPQAMVDAIPKTLLKEMDTAGAHIIRDTLRDAYRLDGCVIEAVIPVKVSDYSPAYLHLRGRVRTAPLLAEH